MSEKQELSFRDQNCNSMTYKTMGYTRLIPTFLTVIDQKEGLSPPGYDGFNKKEQNLSKPALKPGINSRS